MTQTPVAPVGGRYAGARVHRVEDARLLTGQGTFVDDVVLPGMLHACFVRTPFARAKILGIDVSAALAVPGVRHVFTAADLNRDMKAQWHTNAAGADGPDTPRPPLADDEVRFVGDAVAIVVAVDRYIAEDAADLVDVDYEPLPALVDYARGRAHRCARPRRSRIERPRRDQRLAGSALDDVYSSARTWWARRSTSRRTPPSPWRPGAWSSTTPAAPMSSRSTRRPSRPHEMRIFCSRLLGIPEHRIRVVMRDTGGGFGQKIMTQRDEMVAHAPRPQGRGAGEMGGGPAREPVGRGPEPPRARVREDGLRRRRHDPGGAARLLLRQRRLSHSVADAHARDRRWDVPRALPGARGQLHGEGRVVEHGRPRAVPRTVAVRVARPRDAARHRRARDGHRPRRAAAPEPPPSRRTSVHERDGVALRRHRTVGDVRAGTRDPRLRRVPRASRPPRAAWVGTSASGSPTTSNRRPRVRATTRPRRRRSASSRRAR